MSFEELILRQSASRALQSFVEFSASVMNNDVSKYSIDDKSREKIPEAFARWAVFRRY